MQEPERDNAFWSQLSNAEDLSVTIFHLAPFSSSDGDIYRKMCGLSMNLLDVFLSAIVINNCFKLML